MKKLNLSLIKSKITESSKIFKQLPENKMNQLFKFKTPLTKRIKGSIALFCATALVLGSSYASSYLKTHENNIYSTNSFTIIKNGKELCKIRDSKELESLLIKLEENLKTTYKHDIEINNNFEIVSSKAKDREIVSDKALYELLEDNVDYCILGYAINVDGKQVGIVNSESDAKSVLKEVKDYFTQNYDENSIVNVDTAEKVEIKQVKASNKEIKNKDELANYIIKGTNEEQKYTVVEGDTYWTIAEYFNMTLDELITANPNSDPDHIQINDELNLIVPKPFLNVKVTRKIKQEEKIPYETEYNKVSYMYSDEQIVDREGEYGASEIEALVTDQNGIQIAKEVLSEKVLTAPVTEIITTGIQDPPPKKGTGYFINPLPGSYISSRFGSRSGGFHLGQDMAKSAGSSIQAADGGTVTYSGWSGTYGYVIDIDHGGGFTTRYAHCSELYVSVGEKVYQGKVIAAVGSTGLASGPHLHFEVRKYGAVVDPSLYIGTQYR